METVIKVENLSKIYKLYDKPVDRLKESLSLTKKIYHKDHYALSDVSFSIEKGDTVGIIGKNGSGKSTLLKILTGVLTPTKGVVEVNGKVSALLELGAGFNPEYTGVENIYLNGTMMGYSKEDMEKRFSKIESFAEIGEFINQPVKTYSSGMFARLAFAVAINVEPEILIVDEALAVGDTRFQIKCIDKMKELKEKGTTILFVSHATDQVKRFCNKAFWFKEGKIVDMGESSHIVDKYESYMLTGSDEFVKENETSEINLDLESNVIITKPSEVALARIIKVESNCKKMKTFDNLEITVEYEIYEKEIIGFLAGVAIYTPSREYIFGPNTFLDGINIPNSFGRHMVKYTIPKMSLLGGSYSIDVGIFNNEGIVCIDYKADIINIMITNDYFTEGRVFIEHNWEVKY
ncbi:MAG: ABC transporter ATP-binding protein [Erysipelotrichia bacterium]|nr:ABC transporter ATP-binding protein [Erysipelotrichia bacterium]